MKQELEIDGVMYVRADSMEAVKADSLDGMKYVICRTYSAGVFAGYLEKREGKEATMQKVRRLWYWEGAASLSQMAMDGTSKPNSCKFPCEVSRVELTEVIEILDVTDTAKKSIDSVKVWKQ